ncbi:helix-turn-helix transcriptional regulator [Bacillus sp. FJAT-28004]|uniref:helix-turn-helix transcriptional regulator n=1 Tax=Bacillus sp. FJAT-28004 TaxID=1679165 RepID=UPI0006B56AB8|nr:helix-turn-helix transcriptional regulator [Bacillus sp. FJAT-28004]
MSVTTDEVKQQLNKLSDAPISLQRYRQSALSLIKEAVPYAGACCTSVDPMTLLSTGATTEEAVEAIHQQLFEYEYLHEDYNSYERLAQSTIPAAALSEATDGQMDRSGRYREVLMPAGFGDEMRAALLSDGVCWGYLTLFRKAGEPFFIEEEILFITSIAPVLAKSLKKYALELPSTDVVTSLEEPGILVLSEQLQFISSNQAARHWLSALRSLEHIEDDTLPRPIRAVCSRALAQTDSAPDEVKSAKVCIRMPSGLYLSVLASKLDGADGMIQLAVSVEPAKPSDILPLISEAYALSVREKEVIERIIKGFSTKEIAMSLHISAYTVQDHLKSIFAKTGVNSRRELLWELFSRHN